MARMLEKGWLQTYRKYIVKHEAPDIFHFWVGLSLIATSLKRHVWIDRDAYKIYPNLYLFLIEESAVSRKSAAMNIGIGLLRENKNVKTLHGRATMEGLLKFLDRSETVADTSVVRPDGSVLLHADELAYLFGKSSYLADLETFFTTCYTSDPIVEFLTKTAGHAKVKNPCPSILAGSTPEQMASIFPVMSLASGFLGRVIMVSGKRLKKVSSPKLDKNLEEILINDLNHISTLEGEVKLSDECNKEFDRWYNEDLGDPPSKDLAPFYQRKHDHVLKVAMHLSISESDSKIIDLRHFKIAVDQIENVEASLADATSYIGASEQSLLADVIISIVKKHYPVPVSHSLLMSRLYRKIGSGPAFNDLMEGLTECGKLSYAKATSKGMYYTIGDSEKKGEKDVKFTDIGPS